MSTSSSYNHNRKLFFLFLFVLVTIIPLTLSLLNRTQNPQSEAAKTARLYFAPDSSAGTPVRTAVNGNITLDLMIDPGQNSVSFVKFEVLYDGTKLELAPNGFQMHNPPDPTPALRSVLEGPLTQNGRIAALASIGSDPTKAITTPTKIASVTFKAIANTPNPIQVSYGSISQVLSLSSDVNATENILASTTPAYVFVGDANVTITAGPTDPNQPTATNYPTVAPGTPTITPPLPSPTPIGGCNPLAGTLTGDQEVPANNSTETATFLITLGSATSGGVNSTITIFNTMQNIVTAAHIHSPADSGVNAPASVTLYNGEVTPFPETFTTEKVIPLQVVKDMQEGKAYINIHTDQFPDGEIRGQTVCASTTPSPVIDPRNTRISLSLLLHGVGSSGDNPNPRQNTLSNKQPVKPERNISIQVLNNNNQIIVTRLGKITYNAQKGNFTGLVDLGIGLTEGNYVIKVKSDRYLRKLLPGFYTLSPGKEFTVRETDLVAGDVNDDNVLNVLDYNVLYDCGYGVLNPQPMGSPGSKFQQQACQAHTFKANADLNDNGIIASSDYNLFIRELSVQVGE